MGNNVSDDLREQLAVIEHERWAHWQRYMHSLCTRTDDGSLVIPARSVEHWERQIDTAYGDLTEAEKSSDREQVDRYWPLFEAELARVQRAVVEDAETLHICEWETIQRRGGTLQIQICRRCRDVNWPHLDQQVKIFAEKLTQALTAKLFDALADPEPGGDAQ